MAHMFDQDNFQEEVLKSEIPVLVDFFAEWCGPCKMMAPVIEELATEYEGKWKIGKCNIDESPELASEYGIQSIPTIIIFKNGQASDKMIGFKAKDDIKAKLV